jgi:hypothetical protein
MKTRKHDDAVWFLNENESVRKAANPGPPPVFLDHCEEEGVLSDGIDRFIDGLGEADPKFRANC